jgi:hypothetical protein
MLSHDRPSRDYVVRTPCNHLFGRHCLETWLSTQNTCPMCRTVLYELAPPTPTFYTPDLLRLHFPNIAQDHRNLDRVAAELNQLLLVEAMDATGPILEPLLRHLDQWLGTGIMDRIVERYIDSSQRTEQMFETLEQASPYMVVGRTTVERARSAESEADEQAPPTADDGDDYMVIEVVIDIDDLEFESDAESADSTRTLIGVALDGEGEGADNGYDADGESQAEHIDASPNSNGNHEAGENEDKQAQQPESVSQEA